MTVIVTYGEHTLDFTKLPAKSLEAMVKRGVAHFLGNEQAAKVSTRKAKASDDGTPLADDEISALKVQFVSEALAALEAGTVGTASRGPAQDPVEAEMSRIARREINAILKAAFAKFTGKGDERKVTFADGQSFTMDELVDRRLANANEAPRIRKEAEKAIKAAAREAEKVKSAGPLNLNAIG